MLSLKNKVAVVTGGSRGIGLSTARCLSQLGAKVAIWDIETVNVEPIINPDLKNNVIFIKCDVRVDFDIKKATEVTINHFKSVDILVNNASDLYISGLDDDFSAWKNSLDINLLGAGRCCKYLFPYIKLNPYGSIINIGSDSIISTKPGFLTYSTAKSALLGLTKSLAVDYKEYKIRVNMVSPGTVYTPYLQEFSQKNSYPTDLDFFDKHPDFGGKNLYHRIALPEEVANVICFLASDLSIFINGANIPVDAGSTIL